METHTEILNNYNRIELPIDTMSVNFVNNNDDHDVIVYTQFEECYKASINLSNESIYFSLIIIIIDKFN